MTNFLLIFSHSLFTFETCLINTVLFYLLYKPERTAAVCPASKKTGVSGRRRWRGGTPDLSWSSSLSNLWQWRPLRSHKHHNNNNNNNTWASNTFKHFIKPFCWFAAPFVGVAKSVWCIDIIQLVIYSWSVFISKNTNSSRNFYKSGEFLLWCFLDCLLFKRNKCDKLK